MIRRVIQIDDSKCNGCGLCVKACHEGALGIIDGKARLLRDDYCDGLGDCLPNCPQDAIHFIEREALPYDEAAVLNHKKEQKEPKEPKTLKVDFAVPSQLRQWPVQIKLAPIEAPYFQGASLLIAADCTAYAYGNFHQDFIRGRITLIGCPKLDSIDYSEKLTEILRRNDIRDITVVRMQVPCCGGLQNAVLKALQNSGKSIPCQVVTLTNDGRILK